MILFDKMPKSALGVDVVGKLDRQDVSGLPSRCEWSFDLVMTAYVYLFRACELKYRFWERKVYMQALLDRRFKAECKRLGVDSKDLDYYNNEERYRSEMTDLEESCKAELIKQSRWHQLIMARRNHSDLVELEETSNRIEVTSLIIQAIQTNKHECITSKH